MKMLIYVKKRVSQKKKRRRRGGGDFDACCKPNKGINLFLQREKKRRKGSLILLHKDERILSWCF